jgi:hypothetical protein
MQRPKKMRLRETLFAHLYLISGNGRQAAREAGYRGDVGRRATELLKREYVREVVDRGRAHLVAKADLKAERVLRELMRIAFFDFRRLFNPDNSLKQFTELDEETASGISSADFRKGVVRLRFSSKIAALDLLGRYLKLWQGQGNEAADRLKEVIECFKAGACEPNEKKEPIN